MILFCNGDSWTQGDSPAQTVNWDASEYLDWYSIPSSFGMYHVATTSQQYKFYDSEVWPKTLGRLLKFNTVNAGRLGDDNQGIVHRSIYLLEKYLSMTTSNELFVVIGWSSCLREPIFEFDSKNKIKLSQVRPSNYKKDTLPTPTMYDDKFALSVYTLQSYLENKKIKFLFFNAFDTFDYENSRFKTLIKPEYWLNKDPKENHFFNYLKNKYNISHIGEQSENMIQGHPTDKAHIEWGQYLEKYIRKNYEFN